MKLWLRALWPGLCTSLLWMGLSGLAEAEKVTLNLQFSEGRKARYKNTHRIEYFSDQAELIISTQGSMRMSIDSQWRSTEEIQKPEPEPMEEIPEGILAVKALVEKGSGKAVFLGEMQTWEQFPFTLDMLNGRSFIWRIEPTGKVIQFDPDFQAYKVERQDMVTDAFLYWMPEYCLVLPDHPVDEGDTWTGELTFERPFATMDLMGKTAGMTFKSTYKVKKIKKKKGRIEVSVGEEREIEEYRCWVDVSSASLYVVGAGKGRCEWVIDATRGVVLSSKSHMTLDEPTVIKVGRRNPVPNISAEVNIHFERKLEKLEKE